ncbi:MAG: hypothetical protein ABII18_09475 [bacterium]|nr:hypothetical protein [bacterium]MBU1917219.1 hypothetical protein [bacterium]
MRKLSILSIFTICLAIGMVHCGGGTDSDDGGGDVTINSAALAQSMLVSANQSTTYANLSVNAPELIKYLKYTLSANCSDTTADPYVCTMTCTGGGSAEFSYDQTGESMSWDYDSCDYGTVTTDGLITMAFTDNGTTQTIVMTYDDFSVVDSSGTSSISGAMTVTYTESTEESSIAWSSFTGTDATTGTDFTVTGSLVMGPISGTNYVDGDMTFTVGSDSASCNFGDEDGTLEDTDFDYDAAVSNPALFAAACS